ncbi:MAG: hypothetical protein IPP17_27460 [Bacteroidetes bacterium]|nr:hypothetical protein [Bacteroidota bacterium]
MTPAEIKAWMDTLQGHPELIETHISYVILLDDLVYKLKKPVTFSFLDFSTVENRAFYCRRELELNRRLAPEVYLDVVAICRSANGFLVRSADNTEGEVIDYAVKMRRLDANFEMDRALLRGEIKVEYLKVLASKIARFHRDAEVIHKASQSNAANYKADFEDILGQSSVFESLLGNGATLRLTKVAAASNHYLESHQDLIHQRLVDGFVRDVHGDLHTRNIFAYPDPVVFDCIEFNDHFRQIDVLNEVAFLCMDLEANGFPALSATFLEEYVSRMPAMQGRGERLLFVWFKCYRANIRAKVTAIGASQPGDHPAAKQEMALYLRLMEQYAAILTGQEAE